MIAICWKCLYIYEIRGRYQEYRDKWGYSHKTYRRCPRCRSTKIIVRKNFDMSEMEVFQKRIAESQAEFPGKDDYTSLDHIPPDILYTFCSSNRRKKDPEENLEWLKKKGFGIKKAHAVLALLYDRFGPGPRIALPKSKSPVESKKSIFSYCYYADFCEDPRKNLSEGDNCRNQDREICYEIARRKYKGLLPDEASQ